MAMRPLAVLAIIATMSVLQPPAARGQSMPVRFDIPSQDMAAALRLFARIAARPVAFDAADVRGLRSGAVVGRLSPEAALTRLLRGTGLGARPGAGGLFVIVRLPPRQQRPPRISPPSPPPPQPARPGPSPEDIVVTARKTAERAVDIPIAVTAVRGDRLERRGDRSTSDALGEIPGVGVYAAGNGLQNIAVRGVSTTLGANANGYYLDDAPFTGVTVPIAPEVRAWDLDRIEVLRGPQGTLFGEGSLGGTVRIITMAPDLDHWAVKGDAYLSQTQGGGTNEGLKGAANMPLAPGLFAVRVAGTIEALPGWIDDASTGRRKLNDERYATLRVRGLLQPATGLQLGATYASYDTRNPVGGALATDGNQVGQVFLSATRSGYRQYAATLRYDREGTEAFYGFTRTTFGFSNSGQLRRTPLDSDIRISVDTHEARLVSRGPQRLRWTLGAYARQAVRHDRFDAPGFGIANTGTISSGAQALFGEATYRLDSVPIDLSAGLRYYRERLYGSETDAGVRTERPGGHYGSWNPRLSLAWHPDPEATLYASAAKGFRGGQLQPTTALALASIAGIALSATLAQDWIWTYEVGGKALLLDRRLLVEAALYHSDWRNVAVRLPVGITGFNGLVNAEGTRSNGVEIGLTARPSAYVSIAAGAAWIDARYSDDVPGTAITRGQPVDEVTRFASSLAIDYERPLDAVRTLTGRIAWRHNSPRRFPSFPLYRPGDTIDLIDARAGIMAGAITVALFVENLANERGAVTYRTVQPREDGSLDITAPRPRPRTIGLELSARLGPPR